MFVVSPSIVQPVNAKPSLAGLFAIIAHDSFSLYFFDDSIPSLYTSWYSAFVATTDNL